MLHLDRISAASNYLDSTTQQLLGCIKLALKEVTRDFSHSNGSKVFKNVHKKWVWCILVVIQLH